MRCPSCVSLVEINVNEKVLYLLIFTCIYMCAVNFTFCVVKFTENVQIIRIYQRAD